MFMAPASDRTALDWVKAAARRLASGGSEAVAIEPLAREMGVTKGSFYWHFPDRAALLAALIADWEIRATAPMLDRLRRLGGEPADRLSALMATVAGESAGSVHPAFRAWAQKDPSASPAVGRGHVAPPAFFSRQVLSPGYFST